jgi:hypothetical protein
MDSSFINSQWHGSLLFILFTEILELSILLLTTLLIRVTFEAVFSWLAADRFIFWWTSLLRVLFGVHATRMVELL